MLFRNWRAELDAQYKRGRFFTMTLHPQHIGWCNRLAGLEEFLGHMTQPARPVEPDRRGVRPLLDGDLPRRHPSEARAQHLAGLSRQPELSGASFNCGKSVITWRSFDGAGLRPRGARESSDGNGRSAGPQADPIRCQSPRSASGRRRHRRARRHLQAQRAVPARRLQILLLRGHGCDRRQPLPAGRRLPEGQARDRGLRGQQHGGLREGARQVLAARTSISPRGRPTTRCSAWSSTSPSSVPACAASASRRRSFLPTPRRRCARAVERRHRRCVLSRSSACAP